MPTERTRPLRGRHIEDQVARLAHPVEPPRRAEALRSTVGRRADTAVIASGRKRLAPTEVAAAGTRPGSRAEVRLEGELRRGVDSFRGKERR